ncbi:hypothetical protein HPB51_017060 [Rhipicephalus microplus]|uniref:Uncharacterized protein n=1 Tax=Rhipicephalus microplus TaxID=6941 RepID=A0A9J6F550_RHIMP|nr:hypothetical protein HPB51_017060 [Rhipicephalus microplus]
MTERRVSVRERARELEALAAREASPQLAHRARLARRLGLTRADSEPEGGRAGPCHCCSQPADECLCSGDGGGRLLSVPHVPRKKASAPAITPLRGASSGGLVADEGSSCADIRMAWEALCAAAVQGPEASGAISDEPRDENSAPILGAAQGDSARGPLDAILQSLEEICSQLEEVPGGHAGAPVMLPDAGEAASRLNLRCARSQPSSPRVRAKPQLPAYLTLARRARHDDALEIEQIKTILASIDFSRYRKKRGTLVDEGRQPSAMAEQAALQGSRLRELTEKLKSPVGAPGRPSEPWNRRPAPVCRSASFSTSDLPSVPAIPRESLTLPRKAPASRPLTGRGGARDAARVALDDVAMSSLSLDSAVESIVDETPYQREASPPAAVDKRRAQRGCRFAPLDDDGSRGPPQPPEKRKRRKGLAPVEGPKKETGRSLTYPPQRKTAEQELAFGSVDSNGLKALGGRPEKQPSDLSLADSHFCPSEALGEETFGDVVQSLSSRPEQPEPRQEKSQKKKHLSDPSADNTGAATELLLGACCRSEPQLSCPGALHKRQHSGPAALSRTPVPAPPPPPPPLSDSERATSDTERTCSPQRRYSKKRLRGPYGEMLEQEMRKTGEKQKTAFCEELSFLLPSDKSQTSPAVPATTPATTASTTTTTTCGGAKLITTNAPTMAARSRPAHLSNSLSLDDCPAQEFLGVSGGSARGLGAAAKDQRQLPAHGFRHGFLAGVQQVRTRLPPPQPRPNPCRG